MKKNILNSVFGLAVASLMLAACSSADEVATAPAATPEAGETPINFGAYMNRTTTRGGYEGELTTPLLQGVADGFGVMAYYTDNQPYNPNAIPNFMYNQQVTYDTDHWTYSPLKYWPNEFGAAATSTGLDRLSFFAYAPYTEVNPVTGYALTNPEYGIIGMTRSTENGYPKVRYVASFNPSQRVDLCWAAPNRDAVKPAVDDKVEFNFKHALASLNIQIDALFDNAGTLDKNTRIWVRSVTFEGIAIKGELNLNNDAPEWNDLYSNGLLKGEPITIYDGRRDGSEGFAAMPNEKPAAINATLVQSEAYDFDANDDIETPTIDKGVTTTAVNLFEGAVDETTPIYVIPTGGQLKITIVYDVETLDWNLTSSFLSDGSATGSSIENTITKVVESAPGTPINLEAGKQYTINLHLGMTSAKFEVTKVQGWGEDENGDPVPPVTGDTDLPANN